MSNRLATEQSPYLLQHKNNPVNWYPWGDEAFEKAQAEDKPVFLSVGYSTCHWCHVMEEESFEDEEVARLMNDAFVAIKVDREERPDIDSLYMAVCQMMNRQGGWPLTIIMTPDRKPFYAATYIPKQARFGRIGMMELVPRIQELWTEERERVLAEANGVTNALQQASAALKPDGGTIDTDAAEQAFDQLADRFDEAYGGFGHAPKFPSPHNLLFLLRYYYRTDDEDALRMVTTTLTYMRRGGIFDHVGYGFHRYSTDQRWLVPHFEKMLYDQAMLALAYTEAYQVTRHAPFEQTAREVLTYVQRDMTDAKGGFYSAEDADSEDEHGQKEEGAFYLWTTDEVRAVLDEDEADFFIAAYNLRHDGNYLEESTQQKTGKNIPHLQSALSEWAEPREQTEDEARATLEAARRKLFAAREERPRPGLDDKVLTDWNGLMIAAFAKAAWVYDDTPFASAAARAAQFVLEHLRDREGRLLHRYRNGEAAIRAHLDDYAFLVWGLIELYEVTFEPIWLGEALCLTEECIDHFWDEANGGFFFTADDAEALLVRQKEVYDGAIPSGNSVWMSNLLRLARMTGRTEFEDRADALSQFAARAVNAQPSGFTALLSGLEHAQAPAREIVLAGPPDTDSMQAMIDALRVQYHPHDVVVLRPDPDTDDENAPSITALAPYTEQQRAQEGEATAYVCHNFQCDTPTTDPDALIHALAAAEDAAEG